VWILAIFLIMGHGWSYLIQGRFGVCWLFVGRVLPRLFKAFPVVSNDRDFKNITRPKLLLILDISFMFLGLLEPENHVSQSNPPTTTNLVLPSVAVSCRQVPDLCPLLPRLETSRFLLTLLF
jgi:hypothetical protein